MIATLREVNGVLLKFSGYSGFVFVDVVSIAAICYFVQIISP